MKTNPVITHSVISAIMTSILCLFGLYAMGVVVPSVFYYSRELNQYQTALAKKEGVHRSTLWKVWWPRGHEKEFVIPAVVSLVVSILIWKAMS